MALQAKVAEALANIALQQFMKRAKNAATPEAKEMDALIKKYSPSNLANLKDEEDKGLKALKAQQAADRDERLARFNKYYKTPITEKIVLDTVVPIAGDALQTAMNAKGLKHDMFAAALAASQAGKKRSNLSPADDTEAAGAAIGAAANGYESAKDKLIGNIAGERIRKIASQLKADAEKDRMMALSYSENGNMTNGMLDYMRALDRKSY